MSAAADELDELIDGETGVRDDAPEGAGTNLPVVGDHGPGVGIITPQNHGASGLATKDEAVALEGRSDLAARQVGG